MNKIKAELFIFAILTAVFTAIRTEYYPLAVILLLMIFLLKIYSIKNFLVYSFVFLFSFFCLSHQMYEGKEYQLHNLWFVYNDVKNNNLDSDIEEDEKLLQKVYLPSDNSECEINLSNKSNVYDAKICLIKMLLRNIPFFLKKNYNEYTKGEPIIVGSEFYQLKENSYTPELRAQIKPLNSELRDKIINDFVYGSEKFYIRDKVYNPVINCGILVFLLIIGIIFKKPFYIYYFFAWSSVLFIIFLTAPWPNYLYLWAFFVNSYFMLFVLLISVLQGIYSFIAKKLIK